MANLLAAVPLKGAVLSGVVPKVADQVKLVAKVDKAGRVEMAKIAIKQQKCITDSLLLCQLALKHQLMELNGVHQKGANLLIRVQESPVIQAKASDFYRFSSKSAIILVLQEFAAVVSCYRLMLRST